MVLRNQYRCFKSHFVGGLHQVYSNANIHAFFVAVPIHPAGVHVDSSCPESTELVRPKRVPLPFFRTESRIRNASVEANLDELATWYTLGECFGNLRHVVTRPRISGCPPISCGSPRAAGEVKQILTVYENCCTHKGNTRPRHEACCSRQWTGRNYGSRYVQLPSAAGETCLPVGPS